MSLINGFANEYKFVCYLNGKKVGELNPLFRPLIDVLFYGFNEDDVIRCWRNHLPQKSDILIRIRNIIKSVSIKKGIKNSVHVDSITEFIHFLIENGVERDIVIKFLKYHYGDGSTNGKGKKRLSALECKQIMKSDIDLINNAFNNVDLLKKAINRFIIRGNNSFYDINALVYGEVDNFLFLTPEEITAIILSKKDIYSTAVHFGPLICQPKSRCLNYNSLYEKDRFCVQIKWYSLNDDIIEYMNNNVIKLSQALEYLDYMLDS